MTADELDQLAAAQADIRALFAAASARVARWQPAPFVPVPFPAQAARRTVSGAGTPTTAA